MTGLAMTTEWEKEEFGRCIGRLYTPFAIMSCNITPVEHSRPDQIESRVLKGFILPHLMNSIAWVYDHMYVWPI